MRPVFSLLLMILFPLIGLSQDWTEIKPNELPKGIHDYVTSNMPGADIDRAAKGSEQGQDVYAAVINFRNSKRMMIFDAKGNFLRKADDLSSPANNPPAMANTANPKSGSVPESTSGALKMESVQEKALPETIKKTLKDNHTTYTVLSAKLVPLGESPLFQLIVRDANTDNSYLFNAKGEQLKRTVYELNKSPFVHEFPLKK